MSVLSRNKSHEAFHNGNEAHPELTDWKGHLDQSLWSGVRGAFYIIELVRKRQCPFSTFTATGTYTF